jgi:HEAT repeat protein
MVGQDRPRIEALFAQFEQNGTHADTYAELKTLAQGDPDSRQYIAERLPTLIHGGDDKPSLWVVAVQLAGDLKVIEAAPILSDLLRFDHRAAISFGADINLSDDPVAWSLSLIGDPATDSVAGLFQKGDAPTRRRATIVLANVGTPRAREALFRQIDNEPDPALKAFMQTKTN